MAQQLPYKYYKSSNGFVQALPGYNTPYGMQEVSYDEFIKTAKAYPGSSGTWDNKSASGFTGESYFDELTRQGAPELKQGAMSGYVIDDNGVFTTQKAVTDTASQEAAVAAGTMKKVPIGNGYGYIPTGSAADLNMQGGGKVTAATAAPSLKNAGIAKANPSAVANKDYINALYKEAYNRDATAAELARFTKTPTTVKDAANTILGSSKSPFFAPAQPAPGSTGGQPGGQTLPVNPDGTKGTDLPDFIKNDPEFQSLPDKEKELSRTAWITAHSNDVLRKIIADKAMAEAIKIADPIFKQQLLLAKDESERTLATYLANNAEAKKVLDTKLADLKEDIVTGIGRLSAAEAEAKISDLESLRVIADQATRESSSREAGVAAELARTQRRIDAISEDLKTGKQDISLEEQAQLGRQLKEYQRNLQTAQESAVDAGLGFSSIRAQAEQRLAEDLADVSESTRRQSARQQRILETESTRDTTELIASEAEIKRKNQAERVDIARQIEQKYGFDAIPAGVKGKILEFDPTFAAIGVRGNLSAEQQRRETEIQQKKDDLNLQQKRAQADTERQKNVLEKEREQKILDIERAREKAVGTGNLTQTDKTALTGLGETTLGEKAGGDITGTLELERKKNVAAEKEAIIKSQPVI